MSKDFKVVMLGLLGALMSAGVLGLFRQHDQIIRMQEQVKHLEERIDYYHGGER